MNLRPSPRARELVADAIASEGPAYHNLANSVRTGYENLFIRAGLIATERALHSSEDDDEPS
jgi:hypothetical protein